MYYISTRTTGRTWSNTRLPSRASSSSLDGHCMTGERNDETYRIGFLAALDWNVVLGVVLVGLWLHYRALKPMADSETKMANSTAKGGWPTRWPHPCIGQKHRWFRCRSLRSACSVSGSRPARSNGNQSQTRFAPPQCPLWTKGDCLRPSAVLRLYPESVCRCHLPYVRKGQPLFTVYRPGASGDRREYLVAKQNQQQVAQSTVRCSPQRSIAARRGCGASQAVGRSAKRNHSPRIHRPSAAGTGSRFAVSGYITDAMLCPVLPFSRKCASTPSPTFPQFGSGAGLPDELRTYKDRRSAALT